MENIKQVFRNIIEKKNFNVHPDQINVLRRLPLEYLEPPTDEGKEEKIKPTRV